MVHAQVLQKFIWRFSPIANPLTSLLKKGPKHLAWDKAADEAFKNLKVAFTTTPILNHPDLSKLFFVEVDASESGVGV